LTKGNDGIKFESDEGVFQRFFQLPEGEKKVVAGTDHCGTSSVRTDYRSEQRKRDRTVYLHTFLIAHEQIKDA
jgi:hypothetical protein